MLHRCWLTAVLCWWLAGGAWSPAAAGEPPAPPVAEVLLTGVVDLRTTMSDGGHDLDQLAALAREEGIDVLLPSDHLVMTMEYGLPPFRHVLCVRRSRPAVEDQGVPRYLAAVADAGRRHPETLFVPGVEVSPSYWWSGSPWQEGLTAHDWERHLLVYGLDGGDLATLPVIHNPRPWRDWRPPARLYPLAGACVLALAAWPLAGRRGRRVVLGLALVAGLGIADAVVAGRQWQDPYQGDPGPTPYQRVIDAVNRGGGVVLWNHPETKSGKRSLGPIRVDTPPYPEMLQETRGYTGFVGLYGDGGALLAPGGGWDRLLAAGLARGESGPWLVAGADFHRQGENGHRLGDFYTLFVVDAKNAGAVLDAMRHGRMYCGRRHDGRPRPRPWFRVAAGGASAGVGETLKVEAGGRLQLTAGLEPVPAGCRYRLVKDGAVAAAGSGGRLEYQDTVATPAVFRVDFQWPGGRLLANPIVVRPVVHKDEPG